MTHEDFADWDAAYVLGALSTSERAAYEKHLAGCSECAGAVRDLAVIPGLLGKVPPEDVPGEVTEPLPDDLLARTRAAAQGEVTSIRRRRRTRSLVAVAASAALIIGGLTVGGIVWQRSNATAPGVTVAMHEVRTNPLSATLKLYDKPWGTEVDMTCTYLESTAWDSRAVYALYVVDDAGQASSISTWSAGPGSTSKLTAATAVPRAKIAHLQVRSSDGRILLTSTPS